MSQGDSIHSDRTLLPVALDEAGRSSRTSARFRELTEGSELTSTTLERLTTPL